MRNSRMSKLFGLLLMVLLVTLFSPQIDFEPDGGADISFVASAFAEDPPADPPKNPKPGDDPKPKPTPGKKDEEEEDDDPQPDDDPDPNDEPEPREPPQPAPQPKPGDNDYVSRDEYNSLQSRLDALSEARTAEVVQRRVDHAISEQLIDGEDEEAVAQVRTLAKSDDAWKSYKKVARPSTPDHITARKFQNKNVKSLKHTGNQSTLDKVLEHQQA